MKKTIAILLMVLMPAMLVIGCVPQQDYDALMAEYGTLVTRVESAESNLAAVQTDLAAEQSKSAQLESDYAAECSKTDKLESDLGAEQNKVEKLESDLTAKQSEVQKLEKDVSAAQDETQKMTGDYNELNRKMDKAKPYAYILEEYYWTESYEMTTSEIILLGVLVEALNDSECSEKFDDLMDATTITKAEECAVEFYCSIWDGFYEALYPSGTAQ